MSLETISHLRGRMYSRMYSRSMMWYFVDGCWSQPSTECRCECYICCWKKSILEYLTRRRAGFFVVGDTFVDQYGILFRYGKCRQICTGRRDIWFVSVEMIIRFLDLFDTDFQYSPCREEVFGVILGEWFSLMTAIGMRDIVVFRWIPIVDKCHSLIWLVFDK